MKLDANSGLFLVLRTGVLLVTIAAAVFGFRRGGWSPETYPRT